MNLTPFYGLIAEDIALAPDGLSVTFKINPKAKFHNGDPVLAKDVAASFNILTKDKAAAPCTTSTGATWPK